MPRTVIAAGFLSLFLLGAVQSFYGPAQFAMRNAFGISDAGMFLSALFAGSLSGILLYPFIERILKMRNALLLASSMMLIGGVTIASTNHWSLVLIAAFGAGFGYGSAEIGFNALFSTGFGQRSAGMTNILHSMFGFGSIMGPLLVGLFNGDFRAPFWIASILSATLIIFSTQLHHNTSSTAPTNSNGLTPSTSFRFSSGLLLFILLFFTYVIVEVGIASSEPRHLREILGFSERNASFMNSLFWVGLTVGRLISASVSLSIKPANMVLGAIALVLTALLLTHVALLAPAAYVLAGFACGPIFPTALVWLTRSVSGGVAVTAIVVAGASAGGIVATQAVTALSSNAVDIPTALSTYGLLLLLIAFCIWGVTRVHEEVVQEF